jgi:hypothetical protein
MSVQEFDNRQSALPSLPDLSETKGKKIPTFLAVVFLFTLLIPIQPLFGPIRLTPTRAFLAIMFIPLMIGMFTGKGGKFNAIDFLLLFVTLWAFLAMIVNHGFGFAVEPSGVYLVEFFGAYALGRLAIRSFEDFARVTKWFAIILLALFPFAVVEAVTRQPILLNMIPDSVPVNYSDPRMGLRRVQSVFAHPILYGVFVSTGFGLLWFMASNKFKRMVLTFVVCASTFVSLSTGALLAVMTQLILVGWEVTFKFVRARWRIFAVLAVASYIFVDLAATKSPFHVLVNYATLSSGSAYNRILIWNHGSANVIANPIFGLGFNDWVRPRWMNPSVDNYWLLIAMRYGLPAIIAYGTAIFLIIKRLSKIELVTPQEQAARAAFLVSLGGIVLAGGTVHYWHIIMAFVMFFIGSGMWMITGGAKTLEEIDGDIKPKTPAKTLSPYSRQTEVSPRDSGKARKSIHTRGDTLASADNNTAEQPRSPYSRNSTASPTQPRKDPYKRPNGR